MKATVTIAFNGVIDGDIYPSSFISGDIIYGDLAISAISSGNAEVEKVKAKKRPTNKMALSPKNKSGAVSQPGQVSRKKIARKSKKAD